MKTAHTRRTTLLAAGAAAVMSIALSSTVHAATLTVALAANPQMQTAAKLIGVFEQKYPDIKVRFQTLPENQLRPAVLKDVATRGGQYDVVMIGAYEVPLWAQKGWIVDLTSYAKTDTAWNEADLLKPIRNLVSYQDKLYATPFYGSSSFLFYRKDLFAKAGIAMAANPTWDQVADYAAKLNDKASGMSGICLRGVPGWGQNLAPLTTVINTFGGRWFDDKWQPQLADPKTKSAIDFYVNLIRKSGQPDAAKDGWQECLQLFSQGHAAMWYDDTVFAGPALDQAGPGVKGNIGFAPAPVKETKASGWLWAWGLSIPTTSKNRDAAWKLIAWLTSPEYIKLAGEKAGWGQVPPGSRSSTYQIPAYKQATAAFGDLTLESINAADPLHPTTRAVPYTGVQYVSIPEFEQIGDFMSQQLAGAISGQLTVDKAIETSQSKITQIMKDAGYPK